MQANSWHHQWFHFHLSFESGECGNERKKFLKIQYLENKKSFLDQIKSIRLSFGEKIKIAHTSFKKGIAWTIHLISYMEIDLKCWYTINLGGIKICWKHKNCKYDWL